MNAPGKGGGAAVFVQVEDGRIARVHVPRKALERYVLQGVGGRVTDTALGAGLAEIIARAVTE